MNAVLPLFMIYLCYYLPEKKNLNETLNDTELSMDKVSASTRLYNFFHYKDIFLVLVYIFIMHIPPTYVNLQILGVIYVLFLYKCTEFYSYIYGFFEKF